MINACSPGIFKGNCTEDSERCDHYQSVKSGIYGLPSQETALVVEGKISEHQAAIGSWCPESRAQKKNLAYRTIILRSLDF